LPITVAFPAVYNVPEPIIFPVSTAEVNIVVPTLAL